MMENLWFYLYIASAILFGLHSAILNAKLHPEASPWSNILVFVLNAGIPPIGLLLSIYFLSIGKLDQYSIIHTDDGM